MAVFNPVDDFLRGATGMAGLLGQVEQRRQRGELLDMQREQYKHERAIADRKQHMFEEEKDRLDTVRAWTGANQAALKSSLKDNGQVDWDAYNRNLHKNLFAQRGLDHMAALQHPGARFVGFKALPDNPDLVYGVIQLPDGTHDVIAEPGEDGELYLFPENIEQGGPANYAFEQLARIAPEVAAGVVDRMRLERAGLARGQAIDRIFGGGGGSAGATPNMSTAGAGLGSASASTAEPEFAATLETLFAQMPIDQAYATLDQNANPGMRARINTALRASGRMTLDEHAAQATPANTVPQSPTVDSMPPAADTSSTPSSEPTVPTTLPPSALGTSTIPPTDFSSLNLSTSRGLSGVVEAPGAEQEMIAAVGQLLNSRPEAEAYAVLDQSASVPGQRERINAALQQLKLPTLEEHAAGMTAQESIATKAPQYSYFPRGLAESAAEPSPPSDAQRMVAAIGQLLNSRPEAQAYAALNQSATVPGQREAINAALAQLNMPTLEEHAAGMTVEDSLARARPPEAPATSPTLGDRAQNAVGLARGALGLELGAAGQSIDETAQGVENAANMTRGVLGATAGAARRDLGQAVQGVENAANMTRGVLELTGNVIQQGVENAANMSRGLFGFELDAAQQGVENAANMTRGVLGATAGAAQRDLAGLSTEARRTLDTAGEFAYNYGGPGAVDQGLRGLSSAVSGIQQYLADTTARAAGQDVRRAADALGNFAYNYGGQGALDQGWRWLADRGGRFIGGFMDPTGPAQLPDKSASANAAAPSAPSGQIDWQQVSTDAQAAQSDGSGGGASQQQLNQARIASARVARALPQSSTMLGRARKELREGNIDVDTFMKVVDLVQSAGEVKTWLTNEEKTIHVGKDSHGNTVAVQHIPSGLGTSTGRGASPEDVKRAKERLDLWQKIAKSVAPDDEKTQGQVVGAGMYMEDLGLVDSTDPAATEFMRQTLGAVMADVDQGLTDFFMPFGSLSEARSSDWAKAALAKEAGFTRASDYQNQLIDPIKNTVEQVAKANASMKIDAGRAVDVSAAVVGQLMRQHGFTQDQALAAVRGELSQDPRLAEVLSRLPATAIAKALAKKWRGG